MTTTLIARDVNQLTFDLDALLHDVELEQAPAWTGAPLGFTTAYYSPPDLDAAWDRYIFENGRFGCIPNSHMWHRAVAHDGITGSDDIDTPAHTAHVFTADVGCRCLRPYDDRCSCTTAYLHQIICDRCTWHAIGDENTVVEGWHDHAFPGWRTLPVVPETKTDRARAAWIEANYPEHARTPGAPIRTLRQRIGGRHIPGRSPWGGYDLAVVAEDAH